MNEGTKVLSIEECKRFCLAFIKCKMFSYNKNNRKCWIKSDESLNNVIQDPNWISWKKSCPPPRMKFYMSSVINFVSYDVNIISVLN